MPLVCATPNTKQASCLEDAKETSSGIYSQLCRVIRVCLPSAERSNLQIWATASSLASLNWYVLLPVRTLIQAFSFISSPLLIKRNLL